MTSTKKVERGIRKEAGLGLGGSKGKGMDLGKLHKAQRPLAIHSPMWHFLQS